MTDTTHLTASPSAAPLPEELLRQIVDEAGGRVVLVTGAGCSLEAPTNLPLSSDLAAMCHRKLIADRVLEDGDVADPSDLSAVADAVFERTGQQQPLVDRFPLREFKNASPNSGHLCAAALLRENALSDVVTLNYDDALSAALSKLGARDVNALLGPENFTELGVANLVYLHRHVSADPEEWIVRTEHLASEWRNSTMDVLAQRLLASPVVVFVGLGSHAAVLEESIGRIKSAVGEGCHVCFVSPSDPTGSPFHAAVDPDSDVRAGWNDFMKSLCDRVLQEQLSRLGDACTVMIESESWESVDVATELASLQQLGMLCLGAVRSIWLLETAPYLPDSASAPRFWMAELLIAVALVARSTSTTARFADDGLVEFWSGRTLRHLTAPSHGQGVMGWARLDGELRTRNRHRPAHRRPTSYVVSGVNGQRPVGSTPPADIISEATVGDILDAIPPRLHTTEEIREEPTRLFETVDDS